MAITKKIIIPIIIVLLMFMPMVSACNEVLQFENGEIREKDVGSKTYYSYQVGDIYLV